MPLANFKVEAKFSRGQRVQGYHGADTGKPKFGTVRDIKLVFGESGLVVRYGVAYWPDYGVDVRVVEVPENMLSLAEGDQGGPASTFNVTLTEPEPVAA